MSRIRVIGAAAVLAAAPLVFLPGGLFPFQLPKIAVVFLAVVLAAGVPPAGRLPRPLAWLTAAALGWTALLAVLHGAGTAGLLGRYPRYEGALALGAAAGALWAGARLFGRDTGAPGSAAALARLVFARTTALGVIALACLSVVEATGARPVAGTASERVGSLLGNATDQGVYAAVVGLLLIPFATSAWRRGATADATLFTLAEAAAVIAVALSGSRAALLGLVAGGTAVLAAAGWLRHRSATAAGAATAAAAGRRPTGRRKPGPARPEPVRPGVLAAATGSLVVAATLAALLVPATASRLTGADAVARASLSGRWLIWERTVGLALDHPLLGVGPSGFAAAILGRTDPEWARRIGFERPLDSPHDWVLQMLVVGGLPLPALAVAWLVVAGRAAVRPLLGATELSDGVWQRVSAAAAVFAGGVALLTHVTSPSLVALVAVLTGGLVAQDATPARAMAGGGAVMRGRAVAWGWAVAGVAGLLVALTGSVAELPLRTARDAALSGDPEVMSRACDQAHRWRVWDPAVLSVCAQNATLGAESSAAGTPADATAADATASALAAAAVALADRALAADPDAHGARYARAVALEQLGDLERARADLEVVLRRTPDDPAALLRRGVLRAQLGDLEGAVADFEHVLRVDPTNQAAAENLEILRQAD